MYGLSLLPEYDWSLHRSCIICILPSRCLAIGAPDAEIKLQLLSEIAQEHAVEWDSHRAHQEMVAGKAFFDLHFLQQKEANSCLSITTNDLLEAIGDTPSNSDNSAYINFQIVITFQSNMPNTIQDRRSEYLHSRCWRNICSVLYLCRCSSPDIQHVQQSRGRATTQQLWWAPK